MERLALESRWQILFVALIVVAGIVATAGKGLSDLHTHILDLFNTGFVFGVLTTGIYLLVRHYGSNPRSIAVRFVRTAPWMSTAMLGVIVIAFAEWPMGDTGFWVTSGAAVILTAVFVIIGMQRDVTEAAYLALVCVYLASLLASIVFLFVSGKTPVPLAVMTVGFLLVLSVEAGLAALPEYDDFRIHRTSSNVWNLLADASAGLIFLATISAEFVFAFGPGVWQLVPVAAAVGAVAVVVILIVGPGAAIEAVQWRLNARKRGSTSVQ